MVLVRTPGPHRGADTTVTKCGVPYGITDLAQNHFLLSSVGVFLASGDE
jgi:hypothetical protein